MPTHVSANPYLQSKVHTASQPQLQLMLLEGAVRFGRQAQQAWVEPTPAAESLLKRTIDVVESLVHGVSGGRTEISQRLEEQYAFLFRELVACQVNRDAGKLESTLNLLEFERDTWKQACRFCDGADEDFRNTCPDDGQAASVVGRILSSEESRTQVSGGGLSVEA
jgi:flagellar protein FliS